METDSLKSENEKTMKNILGNTQIEKAINIKSEKSLKFFYQKFLIITAFLIYLILVFLFCTKLYSNKSINRKTEEEINSTKFTFDPQKLDNIEQYLKTLTPKSSYKGPIFPDDGKITIDWMLDLINFMKDLENQKTFEEKYIDKVYFLKMLSKAKEIFNEQEEALIDIDIPYGKNFTVVGDIHGQFYDLVHIFEINGYPSKDNYYLFNGDFVDRGFFGLECLTTLIGFKILYPEYFFISRGNHEDKSMNARYGFRIELFNKYDDEIVIDCITEFYKFLPLGHILDKEVLVVHGGLFSQDGVTLDELKKINRFQDVPNNGLMCEILWSDPCEENGVTPSPRGAGVLFGPDVTKKFLKENNLSLLIRSHEVRMEGYQIEPGGQVITVFSAPNYCDEAGNKGGLIKFHGGYMANPIFIKFDASPHPDFYLNK